MKTTTTTPMTTGATTPMTTTTTTPMTTTTTTPITTPTPQKFSITMNVDFKDEYNQENNDLHITVRNAISSEGDKKGVKAQLITFRRGSTIADYEVSGPSSAAPDFQALYYGIIAKLAETYAMIYDGSAFLTFTPNDGFYEQVVTITCGPPPVAFGAVSGAEWSRDTKTIIEDGGHTISKTDKTSTLTISRFISFDNVSPITKTVGCTDEVNLTCSVSDGYQVTFLGYPDAGIGNVITYKYNIPQDCKKDTKTFTCQPNPNPGFTKDITLQISPDTFYCVNETYGKGNKGDKVAVPCAPNYAGEITVICMEDSKFGVLQDNCILLPVQQLLDESQFLTATTLPVFLEQLKSVTVNFTNEVAQSPPNIKAIVKILSNVANRSSLLDISISRNSMENILITADALTLSQTKPSWNRLNINDTINIYNNSKAESVSSSFVQSLETVTRRLVNDTLNINTASIQLNQTTFTNTFDAVFNSSVAIEIEAGGENKTITTIIFDTLDNVLPARDQDNSSFNFINGRVALVQSSGDINNISLTFDILNSTLGNPECVFWNFSLFDGLGGWDNEGCEVVLNINETGTVTCSCNHLTSFSILMSPNSPEGLALDIITYIGVGLSMGSLVICLIIEALIWRKIRKNETSYLRHVSIVNIAVSLLIANIWFIVGAAISDADVKNPPACTAATFFIHFFYLALFFWMLASALLLLYRTTNVFGGGLSKASMLAIGFILGYGAPLIIAAVTIASTAPGNGYIRENAICWLNWEKSKALLAFVIPALLIVVINLIILVVVLYKIVRRRVGANAAQAGERHVLMVIGKSLAVLTPFFGITWGLGVGILANPENEGIHIAFAFFNSLQGFFILLFGTLLDGKVRSEIAALSQLSSGRSGTGTTSAGNSSSSGFGFFRNLRRGRDGYHVSSASSDFQSASNT
ncbi:adhesion G protein-coupled receptor F4-like [Archocentrus centrarchus]|uniref:adhesion G protein-coupled receptor F4-like n=1 Tax=Archocentrus centrarchus TaxID=63155 RepID=UPI0011E9BB24|nr:adhesion G protein-coupled receptor F4-like [Archocentrus centrarchus]